MMAQYYEDQEILKQTSARLIPPNDYYPDCTCQLILTEKHLYVLEDNFDGTYDCHFKIPFSDIIAMEKYIHTPEPTKNGNAPGRNRLSFFFIVVAAIGGIILLPDKSRARKTVQILLEVKYNNKENKPDAVFFERCGNLPGMIKAFKKWTEHRSFQ